MDAPFVYFFFFFSGEKAKKSWASDEVKNNHTFIFLTIDRVVVVKKAEEVNWTFFWNCWLFSNSRLQKRKKMDNIVYVEDLMMEQRWFVVTHVMNGITSVVLVYGKVIHETWRNISALSAKHQTIPIKEDNYPATPRVHRVVQIPAVLLHLHLQNQIKRKNEMLL